MEQNSSSKKLTFSLQKNSDKSYDFSISNKDEDITFLFEETNIFPMKIFELKIALKDLIQLNDNFFIFKNCERLINGIKKCVESEKYNVKYNKEENCVLFEIQNEFFENGKATIKIPEKEKDLKTQVECLTKMVSELKKEIDENKTSKEEAALKSFVGTSILKDDEKKLISSWIHPNKIIKFNLLYSTTDSDSSSTFHYYCDGIFPTVTVVLDTYERKFGGYSTQSWAQSPAGSGNSRAPGSFVFNLSNKQKYDLVNNSNNAVYRYSSYGPTFGNEYTLYLASSSTSSTDNYCSKSSTYNIGNNDLLGGSGTNFQVSCYEVYQVLFE